MSSLADRTIESRANAFSRIELERLLDWYRALGACHDIVPNDDRLADKIRLELARLRTRRPDRPTAH